MGDFDFKVVALQEKERNREWEINKNEIKFNDQVLPGWHFFIWGERREFPIHLNRKVLKIIWQYSPDVIITAGYDSLAYWQAFLYCKLHRKKFILWNETSLLSTGSIRGIRGILKHIIVRGADSYIAFGSKAKEYLEYFGAKPEDIYISANIVDVDYFYQKVYQYRQSDSFLEGRKQYPNILLLYVGQLIKRKGVEQVLKALNKLKDSEIGFIIVGSGPEEENLKKFCQENNLKNVYFEGFHQQEELSKYYALADVFVLSSFEEVWGLVVNEALASGLYVLCSDKAGVGYDLINMDNGQIFDPGKLNELVRLIKQTKDNIGQIRNNRDKINDWANENLSIEESAKSFILAIKSLIK